MIMFCFAYREASAQSLVRTVVSRAWAEKRVNRQRLPEIGGHTSRYQDRIRSGLQAHGAAKYGSGDRSQLEATKGIAKLGRQRKWEEALSLFSSIAEPDPILRAATVDACAKSHKLYHAQELFENMPQKTPSAYNTIICMLIRLGLHAEAKNMIDRRQQDGFALDEDLFISRISAHAYRSEMQGALDAFNEMRASGIQASPYSYGVLLNACARAGAIDTTKELLTRMQSECLSPSDMHWKSILGACQAARNEAAAEEAFKQLRARGCRLDTISYTMMMTCFQGGDALPKAAQLLEEMEQRTITPDEFAYNALLKTALTSDPSQFQAILHKMQAAGVQRNHETDLICHAFSNCPFGRTKDSLHEQQQTHALPNGWQSTVDQKSGREYYWNAEDPNGSVTWERPT